MQYLEAPHSCCTFLLYEVSEVIILKVCVLGDVLGDRDCNNRSNAIKNAVLFERHQERNTPEAPRSW